MLVEILGKVINREHLVRSRLLRDLRLMPVGRVSRFVHLLIFKSLSLLRFRNEEGSSTKLGMLKRYNSVKVGDNIGMKGVSS